MGNSIKSAFNATRYSLEGEVDNLISALYNRMSRVLSTGQKVTSTDYPNIIEKLAGVKTSALGTPVIDYVTLYLDGFSQDKVSGADYQLKADQINVVEDLFKEANNIKSANYDRKRDLEKLINTFSKEDKLYLLTLDNVFINVSQSQNIVRTSIIGENGTVKEFINSDDYVITFTGVLAGYNQFQEDTLSLKKLDAILTQKMPINISSIHLNTIFGIEKIVIDSVSYNQNRKYANLTDISITAYSDFSREFVVPYKKEKFL